MILPTQNSFLLLFLLAAAGPLSAADEPPGRPLEPERPLSADRPEATESPFTVPPRRVQLETDIVGYLRDGGARAWSFLTTNVKLGVAPDVDVQVVLAPYTRVRGGGSADADGFGDLVLRTKINLFGNDGGAAAIAVMPFVKLPTASDGLGNGDVEGGLIVPYARAIGAWGLGLQAEVDLVRDDADTRHTVDFATTAVLGRTLFGPVGGFVEVASTIRGEDGRWGGTANTGLTWLVDPDTQLDAGVRVGLTHADEDVVVFLGITRRF